jgi:hypothetical protein
VRKISFPTEDSFRQYWFCPNCGVLLRRILSLPGGGKFVLNTKSFQKGIEAAIAGKKMNPAAAERASIIAQRYYKESRMTQVQLMGLICPGCQLETVTLTLSHKFDDFSTKFLAIEQQRLYNELLGSSKIPLTEKPLGQGTSIDQTFCSDCGTKIKPNSRFCAECGMAFI